MISANLDISACLVRRPRSTQVLEFLESWQAAADPIAVQAIVIDQATDATTKAINNRYSQTIIFETGRQENMPQALNRALDMARGRYVMLADEGLVVDRAGLTAILSYLDDRPEAGIITPGLVDAHGQKVTNAWSYPGLPTLLFGRPFPAPPSRISPPGSLNPAHPVDWVGAGCMIIRRETLEETGAFDESYQRAYYDLDYCRRARRYGWHVLNMPTCQMRLPANNSYHSKARTHPADLFHFLSKRILGIYKR